jgi:ribosomal protein S18 acetylase RimI-like enzyme
MNPETIKEIELPENFSFRATTLDDAEAVSALCEAESRAYGSPELRDPDEFRSSWQEPKFDLESSSRVVLDAEGQIIAFGAIWDNGEVPVRPWFAWYVHPEYFGQNVEDYLLNWMEETAQRVIERCPADAKIFYQTNSNSQELKRIEFLKRIGYEHVRSFYHMLIDMEQAPPEPKPINGIRIRTFTYPNELLEVVTALEAGFRDHWGFVEAPIEEEVEFWEYELKNDKLFDASLWFLAVNAETDEIAGLCLCRSEAFSKPETAYVMELAVIRKYRRKGIALALLHHAFGEFWRRGRKKVSLGVDASSLTGATRLYEKAGMHIDETWLSFRKVIREGIDLTTSSLEE